MERTLAWGARAIAAALALGCTPADITDPLSKACVDYAYAFCARLQTCSTTAVQLRYGTAATCEAWTRAQCQLSGSAPSSGQTAATQTACTQALPDWACPGFLHSENPPPACQTAPGPLPNGAACAVRQQCQSAYCGASPGHPCGTCATPPPVGASCATMPCALGDSCTGTPPVCQAYAGVGAPCANGLPCAEGLNCVGATATTMGMCQPGITTKDTACVFGGAGCDVNAGLACNAATSTCQTARISPVGGPCGVVADQQAYCSMGVCIRGICVASPPLGAPCDLAGPGCLAPAHCVTADGGTSGTCQIRGATVCE